MTVWDLWESLNMLIRSGKGDYTLNIECLDGLIERADSISIDNEHEEVTIQGV